MIWQHGLPWSDWCDLCSWLDVKYQVSLWPYTCIGRLECNHTFRLCQLWQSFFPPLHKGIMLRRWNIFSFILQIFYSLYILTTSLSPSVCVSVCMCVCVISLHVFTGQIILKNLIELIGQRPWWTTELCLVSIRCKKIYGLCAFTMLKRWQLNTVLYKHQTPFFLLVHDPSSQVRDNKLRSTPKPLSSPSCKRIDARTPKTQ